MGNICSFDVPSGRERRNINLTSPISKEEVVALKDKLKQVAFQKGRIGLKEWKAEFEALGIEDEEFIEDFFFLFDNPKGTHEVDFKEFAVYSALVGRKQRSKKIEYCYRTFDSRGRGTVDGEEMAEMVLAAVRCLKRCNLVLPGLRPTEKVAPVVLTEEEEAKVRRGASKLYDRLRKTQDGVSFREFQRAADRKEIKEVLDYFSALTEALPDSIARNKLNRSSPTMDNGNSGSSSGSSSGEESGKKKGKGKSKKGKSSTKKTSKKSTKSSKGKNKGKGKRKDKGKSKSKCKSKGKGSGKSKEKGKSKGKSNKSSSRASQSKSADSKTGGSSISDESDAGRKTSKSSKKKGSKKSKGKKKHSKSK